MFWIPVAVVVIVIWYILSLSSSIQTARSEKEYNRIRQAEDDLKKIVVDQELENQLFYEMESSIYLDEWKNIVCDFMGGGQEWADYVDYADGRKKATLVLMAKQGKLPAWFVSFGSWLHLTDETMHKPGPHRISPKRGREMNEEFILHVEEYLRKEKQIPAVAVCTVDIPDPMLKTGQRSEFGTLRELRWKYGPGVTHYFTNFRFIKG